MLETQGPPKEGVDMGYSDKPLSEHSLTGTRIRPLIKKHKRDKGGWEERRSDIGV